MPATGKKIRLSFIITALILGAALAAFTGCGSGTVDQTATGVSPGTRNPFGIYSPGTLNEVTPGDAQRMIETLGLDSFRAYEDFNLGLVKDIGIGWMRFDFEFNGYGFVEQPDYLEKAREMGLEVIGCVRPTVDYAPASLPSFEANLRYLVQQYPWIQVWQIGNEPNVSANRTGDYPRFFLAGSRAVRETCPTCRVMVAGVAARYPTEESAQGVYGALLTRIAALAPGEKPFDIFDMHFYGAAGSEGELLDNIVDFRRLLAENGFGEDVEIWLTESATYTGRIVAPGNPPVQSEEQQASELVQRFVTALGAGILRVSWSRPYENYGYSGVVDGFYDNTALVYNGLGQEAARGVKAGTKKISFFAYQTLVAQLNGYDKILSVAPGVYQFTFTGGRSPVYVVWDVGAGPIPGGLLPESSDGLLVVTDMLGKSSRKAAVDIAPGTEPVFVSVE